MAKPNVRIIYKNGAIIDISAKRFVVTKNGAIITKLTWESAKPRPLAVGIDEIAAVWELR